MIRFIVRTLLTAFVIAYVVPAVGGHFTGNFWPDGIVLGLLLALVAWGLTALVFAVVVGTVGLAAIPLVIFAIFGFWLVPAIELKVLAHFSDNLSLGWGSAILSGLVLLIVNSVTSSKSSSSSSAHS